MKSALVAKVLKTDGHCPRLRPEWVIVTVIRVLRRIDLYYNSQNAAPRLAMLTTGRRQNLSSACSVRKVPAAKPAGIRSE